MTNFMKNLSFGMLFAILLTSSHYYTNYRGYLRGFIDGVESAKQTQSETYVKFIVSEITYCESRNRQDIRGKAGEYGVAQYKQKSFNWMKKLAKREDLNWLREEDQRWLLDWAIRNGYENHWKICSERAVHKFRTTQLPKIVASVGAPKKFVKLILAEKELKQCRQDKILYRYPLPKEGQFLLQQLNLL